MVTTPLVVTLAATATELPRRRARRTAIAAPTASARHRTARAALKSLQEWKTW